MAGDLVALDASEPERAGAEFAADWTQPRWALLAAGVCLAGCVARLLTTAAAAYLHVPYSDVHNWIARVFAAERSGDWLGYLWEPQSGQRIPVARLVTALDIEAARGAWPSFLIAGAAAWLLGCALFLLLMLQSRASVRLRLGVGALAAVLLTNAALAEDLAFPVFSVYLFVAGPALGALAAFQLSAERGLRAPAYWASLALAWLASCGNAAGLAIWPALLFCAMAQRRDRGQLWGLFAAAASCGLLVQAGLEVPSESLGRAPASAVAHGLKMAVYFANFAGLPWSRALGGAPGALFGGLVWAGALWTLATTPRHRREAEPGLAALGAGLIVFGLVTAVLATVGRVDELAQPIVPTRYTPFATLLQLGLLLGSAPWLGALGRRRPWVMGALALAGCGLILVADVRGSQRLVAAAERLRAASRAFDREGVQAGAEIHDHPAFAAVVRAELKRRGLPY